MSLTAFVVLLMVMAGIALTSLTVAGVAWIWAALDTQRASREQRKAAEGWTAAAAAWASYAARKEGEPWP